MSNTIRVLLAEDHPLVREYIREALDGAGDIVVVGEAGDGKKAQELCGLLRPDVLLLDLKMPHLTPLSFLTRLRHDFPEVKILVLTTFDDPIYVRGLLQAGASGYLLKDNAMREIRQAVRAVSVDCIWVSPTLRRWVATGTVTEPEPSFNERERVVLQLLAQGWTDGAIAKRLGLSKRAIDLHLQNLYGKLYVSSPEEAMAWARYRGFGCA